ncbi:MAG: RidA family protein [Candidatus Thalassarchaeaceae archaeon]|jgi:2-iminobutanoate/2-iminopropanoate deaminase|nr:RidA family protein [Candidatus Thalassarchaeaceae archaeon]MDP6318425.1 RidA family protein [Candidatus Thalassarchaeaceae archaeon]DAC35105.1 MAG TPA: RidA family protein [Candidatus Poseidoniales archaeon]HIH80167.1 RidA family protein [Candidatus Thalassarchaeaceae archaeon]HJM30466.1 RidA family protein [Candidatus Thalassarchaeaceae archaeon]|tara:strand:+ start:587 stop:964 length:378 start_codon:yes stop_codon:yes gene_type:complete
MNQKKAIRGGVTPLFPYNPCMTVGDDIWVAGQIGIDGGHSIREQTSSALSKIDNLLTEAESSKSDLVMVTVLLENMSDFGDFNEVYASWLEGTILPARAAFAVKELPAGAKVEIIARAVRGSGSA